MRSGSQRLRLVLAGVGVVVTVAIIAVIFTLGRSSAKGARLPNVTSEDLASANLTINSADASTAKISEAQARAAATDNNENAKILDVSFVSVEGGGHFLKPTLVWAVSLDPLTDPAPPPPGDIVTPVPQKTKFNISFVDPDTGGVLFTWVQYQPLDATPAPD